MSSSSSWPAESQPACSWDGIQQGWWLEAHFHLGHTLPTASRASQSSPDLFTKSMKESWVPNWKDLTTQRRHLSARKNKHFFFSECQKTAAASKWPAAFSGSRRVDRYRRKQAAGWDTGARLSVCLSVFLPAVLLVKTQTEKKWCSFDVWPWSG